MLTSTMFLRDDIEQIKEMLSAFSAYHFASDLRQRMEALGLSSPALGARCYVSHTIVDKWRQGKAKPNGKERMKELGMALGMDAAELDGFLYRSGYPRLYAKNPLDSAAKLLLMNCAGWPDVVQLYRELIERLKLLAYAPNVQTVPLATTVMSQDLYDAAAQGKVSLWFVHHQADFAGDAKSQLPDVRLIRFILLYIGDATIHEMSVTGELPVTLKNLLYPIVGGKAVPVRGLREKLIAFGLYVNMTEEELDALLQYARLRPFSEPVTRLDLAVLSSVREAHERYPLYEYENLVRMTARLRASTDAYEQGLLASYEERLCRAREMARYYQKGPRAPEEQAFEEQYTSYSDRGIMDYVRDVLTLLCEDKALTAQDVKPMIDLIERTEEGKSLWN